MNLLILCAIVSAVSATSEYVTKKRCHDVDVEMCRIHNVVVDPCYEGPAFCAMRRSKDYSVTLDMTPFFSADKLKMSMSADVTNDDSYATSIKTSTSDVCDLIACPLKSEERKVFDFNFVLDKRSMGKFPVKVKVWDEENEKHACCVTFMVKVK